MKKKPGVQNNSVDLTNLIRSIQRLEDNPDCFRKAKGNCDRLDCAWRGYCLEKSQDGPMEKKGGDKIMMAKKNAVVAVYNTHTEAEEAIKELEKSGFDMKKLSIIGKDYHAEEHVVGYYNTGERVKYWGKLGAFWGGFWGLLFGSAFFFVPGIGPLVVGGPLVSWIIGALEGAVLIGGLSAVGAALYSIGIPKDSVLKYETSLKSNKFLVVAHGTTEEVEQAKDILEKSKATEMEVHPAT
jgi:uncharacterized membrane protein